MIGQTIKTKREAAGLSVEEVARKARMLQKNILDIEAGNIVVKQTSLIALAWVLGCKPLDLLDGMPVTPELRFRYPGLFPLPKPIEYNGERRLDVSITVTGRNRAEIVDMLTARLRQAAGDLRRLPNFEPLPETLDFRWDAPE